MSAPGGDSTKGLRQVRSGDALFAQRSTLPVKAGFGCVLFGERFDQISNLLVRLETLGITSKVALGGWVRNGQRQLYDTREYLRNMPFAYCSLYFDVGSWVHERRLLHD